MCELLVISSLRPIRLTFSLQTLASHGAGTGRNRDGCGAAFYQGNDVALFREPMATRYLRMVTGVFNIPPVRSRRRDFSCCRAGVSMPRRRFAPLA